MLNAIGVSDKEFLEYKGRPLVRQGDDIYYGDLSAEYHVYMMIMDEKEGAKGIKIPTTLMVQLKQKDSLIPKKQTLCPNGLVDALDIAVAWLDRANADN